MANAEYGMRNAEWATGSQYSPMAGPAGDSVLGKSFVQNLLTRLRSTRAEFNTQYPTRNIQYPRYCKACSH